MQSKAERLTDQHPYGETDEVAFPIQHYRGNANQSGIRVLHVDDESEFGELTSTYLERINNNITVETEPSAGDGLGRLSNEAFDCVVSDYQMPGMDGLAFLESVRDEYPNLPFILFTGKGGEEIAEDAIAAGVTDYLQKGGGTDRYEILANRIRNAVDRYRAEQELWTTLTWYQRLVEQKLAGIYLIQDHEYIYVNERFAEIFGYDQAELIGESVFTNVAAEDRDRVAVNLQKREHGETETLQYTLTGEHKDGTRINLKVHGGRIWFDDQPAVLGTLLETTDTE